MGVDGTCVGPQRKYIRFWTGRGGVPGDRSLNKKKQQETLKGLPYNLKKKVFTKEMFRELTNETYFFKAI